MITEKIDRSFFIGIGGIGMSALARYLLSKGIKVGGYDRTSTPLTKELENEGMKIHYKDDPDLVPRYFKIKEKNLIVYTPAIPSDNREMAYFKENGFTITKRSGLLGMITENSFTISVAGTHGKTTTSSLITHVLKSAGIDCTAFLGGIAVNYGTNYVDGKDKVTVVEADEYDRSFHSLHSDIAVVTSIDPDHLDIYGDFYTMKQAYKEFTLKLKKGGVVIVRDDVVLDSQYRYKLSSVYERFIPNDFLIMGRMKYSKPESMVEEFSIKSPMGDINKLRLSIPGKHNVENAIVAVAIAQILNIPVEKLKTGLSTFDGVKRRFEIHINRPNLLFIDDYAHHPREIFSCLDSLKKKFKERNVTVIFQPHLFSRTRDFAKEFGVSLSIADEVVLLDIYPARERPIAGVSSELIYKFINTHKKIMLKKKELLDWVNANNKNFEIMVTMGAGDIDQLVGPIKNCLNHE